MIPISNLKLLKESKMTAAWRLAQNYSISIGYWYRCWNICALLVDVFAVKAYSWITVTGCYFQLWQFGSNMSFNNSSVWELIIKLQTQQESGSIGKFYFNFTVITRLSYFVKTQTVPKPYDCNLFFFDQLNFDKLFWKCLSFQILLTISSWRKAAGKYYELDKACCPLVQQKWAHKKKFIRKALSSSLV